MPYRMNPPRRLPPRVFRRGPEGRPEAPSGLNVHPGHKAFPDCLDGFSGSDCVADDNRFAQALQFFFQRIECLRSDCENDGIAG
jgi:hypothetical protein